MNSRYKRFFGTDAISYGDWLANTILEYYDGATVYSVTNTIVYCKIPQFSDYVLKIYNYNTTSVNNNYHICVSVGDSYNETTNALNGEVVIISSSNIGSAINSSDAYIDFLLTQHGILIQTNSLNVTNGGVVFCLTLASNDNYYAIGLSNNDAFSNKNYARCVNLVNKTVCYMNPLGTPTLNLGINNEKFNLELHKICLVTDTLRPMLDADELNIVFRNFWATIVNEFDAHCIYFYKRGIMTSNCQYQGINQWSKRSFFFLDESDGALVEEDTETELEIID